MTTAVRRRLAPVKSADLIIEATGCEEFATLRRIDYRAKYYSSVFFLFNSAQKSIHVSFARCMTVRIRYNFLDAMKRFSPKKAFSFQKKKKDE